MEEPRIKVGIISGETLRFSLRGDFDLNGRCVTGDCVATVGRDGMIEVAGCRERSFEFIPVSPSALIELRDVIIGVNFHWERRETQLFTGSLKLIVEDGNVTAINILPLEDYLRSVISSEMSATASKELLKAHAVISRSWLLAQIDKRGDCRDRVPSHTVGDSLADDGERVVWYDREDHKNFDVCADDHCQRYQGVTRQTTPAVDEAVNETRGEVLTYHDELCDARFSKCCGGVFERFENCWESVPHPYLMERRDSEHPEECPDLSIERNAEEWILGTPSAFCDTADSSVLSQILNNYDQETADFYRWKVEYTQDDLSAIIKERSGIDFGKIINLIPVSRGTSGRLWRLEIAGTKRSMIVGKELEIRRVLSKSHLYSSAFIVERSDIDDDGIPGRFILHGAGWGHGVGLCQIGAAVMASKGYGYRAILSHYFIGSECVSLY